MANIVQWITVKGRHIPILEGETKEDALNKLKKGNAEKKSSKPKEDFVVDYPIPDKLPKNKKPSASAKRKQAIKKMVEEKGIENLGTPKTQEEAKKILKSWQEKDEEIKKKQIAENERQKNERNKKEKSVFHSTDTWNRLGEPLNEHRYQVNNNEDIKRMVSDAGKRIFDNEDLTQHVIQLDWNNKEDFYQTGSPLVTKRKNGWNLSPDDTGGARKALIQAHYEVTGETKKPGNKFNYKDKETARKVFERASYIMSNVEEYEMSRRINQYFSGAEKKPKIMNTQYARKVVEAWESNAIKDNFSIGDWVTKYNDGHYDKGLADEAREIISKWQEIAKKRKW